MSKARPDVAKSMETLKQLWTEGESAPQGMTLIQLTAQREALRTALARLDAITPCCQSCEQFDLGTCRKHGDIPPEFQKLPGECPDWQYDQIPF